MLKAHSVSSWLQHTFQENAIAIINLIHFTAPMYSKWRHAFLCLHPNMEKEMESASIWPGNLATKCKYRDKRQRQFIQWMISWLTWREKTKRNKLSALSHNFPQPISKIIPWHYRIILKIWNGENTEAS